MATPFSFEIVTPDKMLFTSEEVTYVGFRALSGNLASKLDICLSLRPWILRR